MTSNSPDNEPKKKESNGWIIFTCIGTILCIVVLFFVNEIIPIIEERYDIEIVLSKSDKTENSPVIPSKDIIPGTHIEVDEVLNLKDDKITWFAPKDEDYHEIFINLDYKKTVHIIRRIKSGFETQVNVYNMPSVVRATQEIGKANKIYILEADFNYNLEPFYAHELKSIGWMSKCNLSEDIIFFISDDHAAEASRILPVYKEVRYQYLVEGNNLILISKDLDDISVAFNKIFEHQN